MSSFLEKIKQQKLLSVGLLALTLIIGVVLGTLINTGVKAERENSVTAPDATSITLPQTVSLGNEFSKLAKRLEPSVVYIHSDYLVKTEKRSTKKEQGDDD